MARSLKKGAFIDEHVIQKVMAAKQSNNPAPIKTWSRRSTIIPDMVGLTFLVHNGKKTYSCVRYRRYDYAQVG